MDGRSVRDKSTYYFKNLAGQRFGHLLAIKPVDKTKHGNLIWECQCDCGNFKNYPSGKLVSGRASNCGCMTSELKRKNAEKHGILSYGKPRTFIIWCDMKARCYNPKAISYKSYGARGIKVCDEWLSFENFHNWAIKNGYEDKLEIDRINNDGDYCPENCRWVTKQFNRSHQRRCRNITVYGVTLNMSQWSKELGKSKNALYKNLHKGEEALKQYIKEQIDSDKGQIHFINKFVGEGREYEK